MSIIEITVYLVLAIFIFSRLYAALGKGTDFRVKYNNKSNNKKDEEQIAEKIPLKPSLNNIKFLENKKEAISKTLELASQANPNFSIEKFMEGAEKAFEIILIAFKESDKKTLENLLDAELAQELILEKNLADISIRNKERALLSIEDKRLEDLQIRDNQIYATIGFLSNQMISPANAKSFIEKVEDTWVFKKPLYSTDMKWLLTKIVISNNGT